MDRQRAAHVALAMTPGIGPARLATLLAAFETPHGALSAPFAFLCSLPGFSRAAATAVARARVEDGEALLRRVAGMEASCLLPDDEAFPAMLREIPEPPTVLFARGDLDLLSRPAVAVVGSRDHSAYGAEACRQVVTAAARAGIVTVSGMARGLDAQAHSQTLDAGGGTIGVLGNGLGVVYPAANRGLYERVQREGLLLTEFPPGERPHASSFPRRNRLISGLARVIVVVEAARGSGTLITVECGLAQGRDIMAVPGAITSPTSIGTNRLIRDGAAPYLEAEDLLACFGELGAAAVRGTEAAGAQLRLEVDLSPEDRLVFEQVPPTGRQVDEIATAAGRTIPDVLGVLSALELQGVIEQLPGWLFRRTG
ncbi:MAG: DNA-processing protein DprA [Gemmatimonadales bacterium]